MLPSDEAVRFGEPVRPGHAVVAETQGFGHAHDVPLLGLILGIAGIDVALPPASITTAVRAPGSPRAAAFKITLIRSESLRIDLERQLEKRMKS